MGYRPWGHKGLDMTEWLSAHTHTIWEPLEEDSTQRTILLS